MTGPPDPSHAEQPAPTAISLARLGPQDRAKFAGIQALPEQEVFSGTAVEAFAEDPSRFDLHGIFEGSDPVGLFKIDRAYSYNIPICADGALGLRAFMIDRDHQGRGIATAAVRALRAHLSKEYPDRPCVDLTVNHANKAAIACYLKGGFVDTGEDWLEGQAGPQDLLRMDLMPVDRPDTLRGRVDGMLDTIRRRIPPGLRLGLGLLLIVGGVFGFLPILGFWMIPLGVAVALLDIRPIWRWVLGRREQRR